MSTPLLVVDLVLRHQKEGAVLEQLGRLIADYLGPDRNLPLSAACKFGSTTLLNWMWECSPTSATDRTPSWSLTNYLRSDPHYYQYQFHESVLVAAKEGDLQVIQWLMEHFSGCEVPESVVEVAAEHGRLDILQLLLKHDAGHRVDEGPSRKKRKVGPAGGEPMPEKEPESRGHDGGGNVVKWGGRSLVSALYSHRLDILRFLYENTPHGVSSDRKETLMGLNVEKIVDLLKPRDDCNCNKWPHAAEPIGFELLLDSGRLDDKSKAAFALGKLVQLGHLDLMKKIWEKHAQLTSMGGWMNEWMEAMATACEMGNLAILQWMMEHTSGRAVIAHYRKYDGRVSSLLYFATDAGHLDVMEYLYQQGAAIEFGYALLCAIRRDNMDAVKWLLASFPSSEKLPEYCVLVEAARHGRVEMLQYFQSAVSLEVPGFPGSKPSSIPQAGTEYSFRILVAAANRYSKGSCAYDDSQWRPTEAMDDAAANGQLESVKWLHNNRSEGCTSKAMDDAAAYGQLKVLKWLHANRSEGYTNSAIFYAARNDRSEVVKWLVTQSPMESADVAMNHAVANGNLALVQWLHTEANAECTEKVMICAAEHGHLEVLKYLYARRHKDSALTSCAVAAETALAGGHFRVAHWCLEHFPAHSPGVVNVPSLHPFESLLLLRRFYPEMFSVGDLAAIREKVTTRSTTEFSCIMRWLEAQVSDS